ncbi:unnamed protein product [Rhodiola kirilowii]
MLVGLANDAKAAKKGGERPFNGLVDVYRKTLQSDGVAGAGLYRGFNISCVGMYDSFKPVLLTGKLQDSFFLLLVGSLPMALVSHSTLLTQLEEDV